MTELARAFGHPRERRHVPGHPNQRVVRDSEHILAARDRNQVVPRLWERLAPSIGIERVADANLEQRVEIDLVVQRPPDVAGFLGGDCREQVEAERRAGEGRLDLVTKCGLEPLEIVSVSHTKE